MSTHTLRCTWPILNQNRTRNQLIAEATETIPALAVEAGATLDVHSGEPTWRIAPAGAGLVLIADIPARPRTAVAA